MPTITRWFIKTALIYFTLALLAGLLLAAQAVLPLTFPPLFPIYFHLLAEGWITFLIIGVAIWMFPKFSREQPRGSELLAWASYALLNGGLVLRLIFEPLHSASPATIWGWMLILSSLFQWVGGMIFVVTAWQRVKER